MRPVGFRASRPARALSVADPIEVHESFGDEGVVAPLLAAAAVM